MLLEHRGNLARLFDMRRTSIFSHGMNEAQILLNNLVKKRESGGE